jgi:hypothetical protein
MWGRVGQAKKRRDVLQDTQVYVTACLCDEDAKRYPQTMVPTSELRKQGSHLTRTVAVEPGTRIVQQPLQSVRFTAGSLIIKYVRMGDCKRERGCDAHLDSRLLPNYFHRSDISPGKLFRSNAVRRSAHLPRVRSPLVCERAGGSGAGCDGIEKETGLIQKV